MRKLLPTLLLAALATAGSISGSVLCFDEAHHNVHTSTGGYAPFAELVQGLGHDLVVLDGPWSASGLARCAILVSVSPRGAGREHSLEDKGRPAFTPSEVSSLEDWLATGRSLLLITDHPPIGSAVRPVADLLGVEMSSAITEDPEHEDAQGRFLLFSRHNGLLESHPITDGTSPGERVSRIGTFLGQSLAGPPGSSSLLTLGPFAQDRHRRSEGRLWLDPDPSDRLEPAGGRSQAIAFSFGSSRVVVLGEAAMLTSRGSQSGFEQPGLDNRQLAVNIVNWLSSP